MPGIEPTSVTGEASALPTVLLFSHIVFVAWATPNGVCSNSAFRSHSQRDSGDHMGCRGQTQVSLGARQAVPGLVLTPVKTPCLSLHFDLPFMDLRFLGHTQQNWGSSQPCAPRGMQCGGWDPHPPLSPLKSRTCPLDEKSLPAEGALGCSENQLMGMGGSELPWNSLGTAPTA